MWPSKDCTSEALLDFILALVRNWCLLPCLRRQSFPFESRNIGSEHLEEKFHMVLSDIECKSTAAYIL